MGRRVDEQSSIRRTLPGQGNFMDSIDPEKFIALLKNPIFLVMLGWLIKEIWMGSARLSNKINELNLSMVRLETKIEAIEKFSESIPKLKDDITAAHDKIRELRQVSS